MSKVEWVKITTDMFDNRKIKHLRKLPEGNNIVLIWVMLLTMAGRCNSGGMIFLTENIAYTPKMLADELDFEESTVRLALEALERLGMVVTDDGFLTIAGWEEHQNIEGMEKIREQNRLRKQKQRQKQLAECSECDGHVTVTECHATDIDKEEDKEKDIDIDKKEKDKKEKTPLDMALDDFIEFRKKMRKPLTEKAKQLLLKKLDDLAPNDEKKKIAIINQSILNGWQGVFPLKDGSENKGGKKSNGYYGRFAEPDYDAMEDLPC